MITDEQYQKAKEQKDGAQDIINQYFKEKQLKFDERMKKNPIFTDDELIYSATARCPCGHGLAYPKDCGVHHYWDCSAILKGIAQPDIKHTAQLPFMFYDIKSESDYRGSTRPF
jgi:hypothetical protein